MWTFSGAWNLVLRAFSPLVPRHLTLVTVTLSDHEPFRPYASPGVLLGTDARDMGAGGAGVHRTAYARATGDLDAGCQNSIGGVVALGNPGTGDCVALCAVSARTAKIATQPAGASGSLRCGGGAV